jgi:outer membrane protein assembly factor BamB
MTMQFDPTALRDGPEEPRGETIWSGRLSALLLLAAGTMAILLMLGWLAFVPHIPRIQEVWHVRVPTGVEATPVLAGDVLVIGCMDGSVVGLDARTGNCLYWTRPALLGIAGGMTSAGGRVIFGADDNGVYSVEPATGAVTARAFTNGPVRTTPLVAGDRLFVGSDDGHLWEFRLPGLQRVGSPLYAGSAIAADPLLVGDEVVFVPLQGGVHFLNRSKHTLRIGAVPGPVHSSPCAVRTRVWVGNDLGELSSVDAVTLEVVRAEALPYPIRSHLAAGEGALFVGTNGGSLRVYRETPLSWLLDLPAEAAVRAQPLLLGSHVVYAADDGMVRVCDRGRRRVLAERQLEQARITATPVLDDTGTLYVATAAGDVYALRHPALVP